MAVQCAEFGERKGERTEVFVWVFFVEDKLYWEMLG